MDIANAFNDIPYRLGFTGPSEVTSSSWVTINELYQFADDAIKRLAYQAGLFPIYDTSITIVANTPTYALPGTHVFTVAAWMGTQPLRITPVRDLWALDATWQNTINPTALRCSFDAGSIGTITLYPNPTVGGATLAQICQEFPGTVASGSSVVQLSLVLQDYFAYVMLLGARGKESDYAQPDMAQHYQERVSLYEQVMEHLWGPGQ
jgi:hypothetical protein